MKKTITLFLSLIMILGLVACGDNTSVSTDANTPAETQITNIAEYEDSVLELRDAVSKTNDDGEDILYVDAVYTNNGNEGLYAMSAFAVRAFQNDMELEECSDINGNEAALITEVKNGASVTVSYAFKLSDASEVEVLVGEPTADQTTIGQKTYTLK